MKKSFYFCAHLKGVQNFRFTGKEAEIIPKEPGQVMLPRDFRRQKAINIALLKVILAVKIGWVSGCFFTINHLE